MPLDATLPPADRILLRECPFLETVWKRRTTRGMAARLAHIRSLTIKGLLHGRVERAGTDSYDYRVTLTDKGRAALGLAPVNEQ